MDSGLAKWGSAVDNAICLIGADPQIVDWHILTLLVHANRSPFANSYKKNLHRIKSHTFANLGKSEIPQNYDEDLFFILVYGTRR